MRCPRCETVVMEELDRSGVTMDRCPSCRGIWLDRGELEKITARAAAEMAGHGEQRVPAQPPPYRGDSGYRDYDPPSSRRGHYRKKSFWHDLFD